FSLSSSCAHRHLHSFPTRRSSDLSPQAFEKVVDRLLASPRYGERWGRHWLDLARFAESEGFKADEPRPNAWRYRDYVIQSFNARSEEHTSELQSRSDLVCRLLLEK